MSRTKTDTEISSLTQFSLTFVSTLYKNMKCVEVHRKIKTVFCTCFRNEQEGSVTVDNGTTVTKRSPGKLRQLNTNTGLYIGNDTLVKCKHISQPS